MSCFRTGGDGLNHWDRGVGLGQGCLTFAVFLFELLQEALDGAAVIVAALAELLGWGQGAELRVYGDLFDRGLVILRGFPLVFRQVEAGDLEAVEQ